MDNCKHVTRVTPAADHSILNPQKWLCSVCGTTESVWACLSCPTVACGRYIAEHAIKHYADTKHPLAIEVNEKYVFCYECDEYVLNDNAAGDIKILRSALSAVATQSFHDIEARGRRILRSHSYHGGAPFNKRLEDEDLHFTALKFRRYYILAKTFAAWRHYVQAAKQLKSGQPPTVTIQKSPRRIESPPFTTTIGKKRPIVPGVVGLRNLGNTCYMNSILQVLSHLKEFRRYFLQLKCSEPPSNPSSLSTKDGPADRVKTYVRQTTLECFQYISDDCPGPSMKGGLNGGGSARSSTHRKQQQVAGYSKANSLSLAQELHALFRVIWSGKWAIVSPHKMLSAVWSIIPFFKGYTQQDAQEFLCELLDKVQTELERFYPSSSPGTSLYASSHLDFISRLFQGQLVSEVTCLECGNKSRTYEPFMDLSLEFPPRFQKQSTAPSPCHVTEMLALFTETEKLDGPIYACEACNRKRRQSSGKSPVLTEAEKRMMINKLPQVLRLHLKRFMWSGRNHRGKISVHVQFDEELDMRPFCHPEGAESPFLYQLSSVVMHHGKGFGKGHYTAYCWNEEAESWVHCNDARMELCSFEDVVHSQAYILFYLRKPPPAQGVGVAKRNLKRSLDSAVFEEQADEDIVFNFKNSTIPKFVELKRKMDDTPEGAPVLKRRQTTMW